MKNTYWLLAASLGMVAVSNAALYTIGNGTGAAAAGIQTEQGTTFRNGSTAGSAFTGTNGGISAGPGVVALGIFSTDALTGLTRDQLVSSFTIFGDANTFNSGGTGGNRSIFTAPEAGVVAGSTFENKFIYVFAGNGATFAESSQFFVVRTAVLFTAAQDEIPTANESVISPANTTLLFGSLAADVRTTNADAVPTPGWTMFTPVPEPSSALLGAVASIGLLRRRRN